VFKVKISLHFLHLPQVFDPEKGTKKAKKLQKPGHLLIAFFGDETFAWHKPEDLIPFEANLEVKSKQTGGGKLFQDAIEGAEEVRDPFDIANLPAFEIGFLPTQAVDILNGQSDCDISGVQRGQGVPSSD
jgi:hypothetical protein